MPRGVSLSIPAPIGGLNTRDKITELQPSEARVLENWLPESGKLVIRPGYTVHAELAAGDSLVLNDGTSYILLNDGSTILINSATTAGGAVQTLVEWSGASASTDFLAASGGSIYEVTTTGFKDTALASSLSSNRWQTANFNARTFLVNGVDAPKDYNGSAIASTSWSGSGLTLTNLVNVAAVRDRLWFCENSSADVWYGGIGSITGTLTKFQLSQIASGGFCMAIGSWSQDGGSGMDDLIAFVMSTGQVIVYQGDPATTFSLVGKYDTGAAPIGRQCLVKLAGELLVITRFGLLPLSAAVAGNALDLAALNPWGKVAPLIAEYAVTYGANAGWQAVLLNGILYLNIPLTAQVLSTQIVLNTRTGAFTTYTGWNCECLGTFNNELYFGSGTGAEVRKATAGTDDNGTAIKAIARQAFIQPDNNGKSFVYTAIRPRIAAQGFISGTVGVDTDYFSSGFISDSVELAATSNETSWGSEWGSPWGSESEPTNTWISTTGEGRSFGVKLSVQSEANSAEWSSSDVLMVPGSIK